MELALDRICMASVIRTKRQPLPRINNGTSKRIWLLLYSEGGWWSNAEIKDRLRMAWNRQVLVEMVKGGFLVRREVQTPEGRELRHGVDKSCKVPRGVTVDELWDILQITAQSKQ